MTGEIASELITSLEYHLGARNVAPETALQYTGALRRFCLWLPHDDLAAVKLADVERYITGLSRSGLAPATVRYQFSGLRAALKWWAGRAGLPSPMAGMSAPRVRETSKDVVRPDDVKRVIKWLTLSKQFRDAAAIALLFDVGLRVSELISLDWSDIDWKAGTIMVEETKNRQIRSVPLNAMAGEALDLWKTRRANKAEPWIFGDTRPGRSARLTRSGMLQLVKKAFEMIDIPGISPHDLRHSMATVYMDRDGAREDDLMAIGGWKSETMVRRYSRTGRENRAMKEFRKHSPLSQ